MFLQGGDSGFIIPPELQSRVLYLNLGTTRYLLGTHSFVPYPFGYTIPSSDIGFVFVQKPSSSPVYSASSFNTTGSFAFLSLSLLLGFLTLSLVIGFLIPQRICRMPLLMRFGVDSGTLKDSKDNLNSWNSTSSVDSGIASGASGLLGGLFQNLGTFLFSVSLLCFGAVVLRMLIRKAVDG